MRIDSAYDHCVRVLGYKPDTGSEYVRYNTLCPDCHSAISVVKKGNIGIEACHRCDFRTGALPKVKNLTNRTKATGLKWADRVRKNYGEKCAICGSEENLHTHHIFPVALYPAYANLVPNGICLCQKCHMDLHKKAYKP